MPNRFLPQDMMFERDGESGDTEICVDGSVNPVSFLVKPPAGQIWIMHYFSLVFVDASANWGSALFGPGPALTNGLQILFDAFDPPVEVVEATIKNNVDLDHFFGGSEQAIGTGPGGGIYNTDRFFSGRMIFSLTTFSEKFNREPDRNVFLDGDNGDRAIIRVNDDLTPITVAGGTITMSGRFYVRIKS
jgi:hypothetical protein